MVGLLRVGGSLYLWKLGERLGWGRRIWALEVDSCTMVCVWSMITTVMDNTNSPSYIAGGGPGMMMMACGGSSSSRIVSQGLLETTFVVTHPPSPLFPISLTTLCLLSPRSRPPFKHLIQPCYALSQKRLLLSHTQYLCGVLRLLLPLPLRLEA